MLQEAHVGLAIIGQHDDDEDVDDDDDYKVVLVDLLRLDPQISRLLGDLQSLDVEEQLRVALLVGDLSQFCRVICSGVS